MDNEREDELNREHAAVFAAFSDPTRLRLVKILAGQTQGSTLCVNALAGILGISQSAVSQHLRMLKGLNLVKGDRQGYRVHYEINQEAFDHIREMMTDALSGTDIHCTECQHGDKDISKN